MSPVHAHHEAQLIVEAGKSGTVRLDMHPLPIMATIVHVISQSSRVALVCIPLGGGAIIRIPFPTAGIFQYEATAQTITIFNNADLQHTFEVTILYG